MQELEDCRSNLRRLYQVIDYAVVGACAGHDKWHVAIVGGIAAVLGHFVDPAGVDDAVLAEADDVRGVAVAAGRVQQRVRGGAGVDLRQARRGDAGGVRPRPGIGVGCQLVMNITTVYMLIVM